MEAFREYLKAEFERRTATNKSYSLRSFARQMRVHHATLSGYLSGKRPITPAALKSLAEPLGIGPKETDRFMDPRAQMRKKRTGDFRQIQDDTFASVSEWYFDAILELALLPKFKLNAQNVATALGIGKARAAAALAILQRVQMLHVQGNRLVLTHKNTTNVLDADQTSAAQLKHQRQILTKSLEALNEVARVDRDHSSTALAVQKSDLPKVKKLIREFSMELSQYLQREEADLDEVYQLQVSFFPLTLKKDAKS